MGKRTPIVEWHVAENDADWTAHTSASTSDDTLIVMPASHGRLGTKRFLSGIAVILLLLVGTGIWWWRMVQVRSHPERQVLAKAPDPLAASLINFLMQEEPRVATAPFRQTHTAITEQVADRQALAEYQATMAGQSPFARQASDVAADPDTPLDITLETLATQGEQVVARVFMRPRSGTPTYRQTRFYRRTGEVWLQTAPDANLWGAERSLETHSFIFHFRQNDAPAVIAVAPQVEALYIALRRNFGLPLTPAAKKLLIEVSVTQSPGKPLFEQSNYEGFVMNERLVVASPALYQAPVNISDADLLVQSISLPLLGRMLAQASEHYAIGAAWQSLVSGLRLWQLWDLDLPLAAWHKEVVKWLYVDLPATRPGQPIVLPERYQELCAAHRLWLLSPTQLEIPLACTDLDQQNWFFSALGPHEALTHLEQLTVPMPSSAYMSNAGFLHAVDHPGQTVALATLIEYAVATYGRQRLPALLAGLGQYDGWETLLPAVYGVSPAEFEAGWQAYLAAYYGVQGIH